MKTTILIFFAPLLLLLSCTKNNHNATPATMLKADFFLFGVTGGFGGVAQAYYFNNGKLYYLKNTRYDITNIAISPLDSVMSAENYKKATALLYTFPTYLTNHPDTAYRCNQCADQFSVYITYTINGKSSYWSIDDVDDAIPAPLKGYPQYVLSVINSLK